MSQQNDQGPPPIIGAIFNGDTESLEVGEQFELALIHKADGELPPSTEVSPTWLGTIDGENWTLTDACRLMCEIEDERKKQS